MSCKEYRKLLFAILLVLLAMIRGTFLLDSAFFDNGKSALSFNDAEASYIAELENEDSPVKDGESKGAKLVVPCGDPIGIYVKSKGVMVIAPGEINDKNGNNISPCSEFVMAGDYITSINGKEIRDKQELIEEVKESDGAEVNLSILRDTEKINCKVVPADTDKGYMLGLWVKDDISGIGTLTYVDENGFAALGHSINDNDTGKMFKVSDGAMYMARLVNIVKPKDGKPGKLEGVIDYSKSNIIGRIKENSEAGVNGYLTKYGVDKLNSKEWIKVADDEEIHLGEAYILSSISGHKEYYKVEIVDIDLSNNSNKNLEICVKDDRLFELTGGIVQGLSGTPIIQDGNLVGAVTHVFINEPTKGYGILARNMIEEGLN